MCSYAEQDLIVDPNQFGQPQSAESSGQVRATALQPPQTFRILKKGNGEGFIPYGWE